MAISFDYMSALGGFLLWILFGYSTSLLNCDLQRVMTTNIIAKHIFIFICLFFLISIFISPNQPPLNAFYNTCLLYLFFILLTKSTIVFIMIIIVLITIDQSILLDINYKLKQDPNANVTNHKKIRDILMICTILVAVIGFVFYYYKKRGDYGEDFSYISFILGSNGDVVCKN